jgi:hypothetical protein
MRLAALVAVAACTDRERPTFQEPADLVGPHSEIHAPSVDTTVSAGPFVSVTGVTGDADRVDTVYFQVAGSAELFPPFVGSQDTVRFNIPVATSGLGGRKVTFLVFGVDHLGNRGDTAYRVIDIR